MLGLFSDRRCLAHRAPAGYPERPERLAGILAHWRASGREAREAGPHPEATGAVAALHDQGYLGRFRRAVERGDGLFDSADNPLSSGTWEAAWAAVDAVLHAADHVAAPPGAAAFAAVRPPGHHAERGLAMGFCFLGNVAVAAEHLRRRHGLERVAIFDFDVHHGNGTQHLFAERGDVLYVSTHQYPFYPGTGAAEERGVGPGLGATVNLPLPGGTGDQGYRRALAERVLPALRAFRPQALLLSAGFDAWESDPLGGMRVTAAGFEEWAESLGALAREVCAGRVLSVLEGGYDLGALPRLVDSHLTGLERGLRG